VGVGDGFGAEVININGREDDADACGAEPQADNRIAEMNNRMMQGWGDFMCMFGRRKELLFCVYTVGLRLSVVCVLSANPRKFSRIKVQIRAD
jgi:hypothetical protein